MLGARHRLFSAQRREQCGRAVPSVTMGLLVVLLLYAGARRAGPGVAWPPPEQMITRPPELRLLQSARMCQGKYPPQVMDMLVRKMHERGTRRVVFAALLRNNEPILPEWEQALFGAIARVGHQNALVSIVESGSRDTTSEVLKGLERRLAAHGVLHSVSIGTQLVQPVWKAGDPSTGNRIEFLARLRNAVLWPMIELERRRAVPRFDKVVYINDVLLCAGDMLRLLAHDADMSCGYDFVEPFFYDNWVFEHALFDPPTRQSHERCVRNQSYSPRPPNPCGKDAGERPWRVFCCWNGVTAFSAEPIYRGVRFRRGMVELGKQDCSQSECSLFCLDLQRLGYSRVMVDPSVQVAYTRAARDKWWRQSRPETRRDVVSAAYSSVAAKSWRCCELANDGQQYIDWGQCEQRDLQLPPSLGECRGGREHDCLKYQPSRWEVPWQWNASASRH